MNFFQRISEEWKSRVQRQAEFWFWGYTLRKCQGDLLKSDHDLAYVSFLPHDLVMGGIPHTGSRHDSVRPNRRQPTRLPRPWDSPGKNTGVGCHFLLQCVKVKVKVKSLSRVRLSVTPWTAAHQAPPSMGFSRQEYWSGVPLPGDYLIYPDGTLV